MAEEEYDDSSVASGTLTTSSSGLINCDVAFFCDESFSSEILEAESTLLERHDITAAISCRDLPAGRPVYMNFFSLAKRSKLRVFLVTDTILKDPSFQLHLRILNHPKFGSETNSFLLLLQKRRFIKSIPEHLTDLTCQILEPRITAEGIVREIVGFFNNFHKLVCEEEPDLEQSTSEESEYQPIRRRFKSRKGGDDAEKSNEAQFKNLFGRVTTKRCYILISSPIRVTSQSLSHITCVPWVRVFDFDSKSRTDGLLLWAEEKLSERHHIKTNGSDQIEAPDENIINWISITDCPECSTGQAARQSSVPQNAIWRHGESLVDHCVGKKVPLILVMWYSQNSALDETLDNFLTGLRHHLEGRLNSFDCIVCVDRMPSRSSTQYRTFQRLGIVNSAIVVPVDDLCEWIKECAEQSADVADGGYSSEMVKTLPKFPEEDEENAFFEIREEELSWVRSVMYLLLQCKTAGTVTHTAFEAFRSLAMSFLKGSRIHWNVLESGKYDVERDLLAKVKNHIEFKHLSTGRSGMITIYHTPGGGGTTFARRLLHELRNKVPCAELEHYSKSVEDSLTFLRNHTFLPTVVLLDGNSMNDVKKLRALAVKVRLILIHVRRDIGGPGKRISNENEFFLDARVSPNESKQFLKVYSQAVAESSHKLSALKTLSENCTLEESPYIFEYGMTAFQSQFHGVRRYVHGYLQLHNSETLESWHRILVLLSLANYYGHRGLPCKLFSKLLDKPDEKIVDIEDLSPAAQHFITDEDVSWKITHYVVSKLIIEQVLVRRPTTEYECPEYSLSGEACRQLSKWALEFIDNIAKYVGVTKTLASHIYEILTSVFIRRNYDDPSDRETGYKTHFAKIIEDITSAQERETVFKKLVESFPGQAEFRAHLGRFYSKQGEFDKADECFKQAIKVRKQVIRGGDSVYVKTAESTSKPDDVMERIHNMTAFACISSIRSRIGVKMGKLVPRILEQKNRPELIRYCLLRANQAIGYFENGRLYYHNSSNPSFANIGELKVRLQLSELAKIVSKDDLESLRRKPPPYCELAEFVFQSFHECDRLLAECIADRSRQIDIPEGEINYCFNNYNYFFKNATEALKQWAGNDNSMHSMKCHLSILKAKIKQENKAAQGRRFFKHNEDIKSTEDVSAVVDLYEKICNRVMTTGASTRVSSYMMEWLRAIRHRHMKKIYTQSDVLAKVEEWNERKETGSLSSFYCYVLCTVICISSLSKDLANLYAGKSRKLREDFKRHDNVVINTSDSWEWLGKESQYFKRLIHSTELGEWNGEFWTDHEKISTLQVCSGSIQYCRVHDGIIILDGERYEKIFVFFVPKKYDIASSHSTKGTRVEFYLAFNTRRLAEAYEVILLKKYPCPSCNTPTEISTLGKKMSEQYAICNNCEKKVRIPRNYNS